MSVVMAIPKSKYCKRGHLRGPDNLAEGRKCRLCVRMSQAKYAATAHYKKRKRAYQATYVRSIREKRRAYMKEFRSRTEQLEKDKARSKSAAAITSGRLKRLPCRDCGKRAEAHHPDYSKPLEVIWLCPEHHAQEHKKMKAGAPTH